MECTVSTETGRTWQEYTRGTRSHIVLPCPLCNAWVSPEREHLVGWQEAETQMEAGQTARFSCPACNETWSDDLRIAANRSSRLVHDGQSISSDGTVEGPPPATDTLGFRWSAVNNLFSATSEIAAEEWRASRAADEDNAERERRQFVWCLPVVPTKWTDAEIETHELACRVAEVPRGVVPANSTSLTVAMDLGKYLNHWIVVAWTPGPFGHVVDYGRIEVASDDLGVEQATMVALRQFRAMVLEGWPIGVVGGETLKPQLTFVDAGYMTDVVYAFCRESGNRFLPSVGRGASQQHQQWYDRPTQTGSIVKHLGEGFHINWLPNANVHLAEVNADHWKTWVHQRLSTPASRPGAITFFQASPTEHLSFAKHLTAEVKTEEFISGKGMVTKWDRKRKQNHWFDALYNACAAGHYCGVRLVDEVKQDVPQPAKRSAPPRLRPDGSPWIDHDRWRQTHRRVWGR
ncbi:MAG: terminase gpA endonuclease subunit [Pirellulaceae bacterium]